MGPSWERDNQAPLCLKISCSFGTLSVMNRPISNWASSLWDFSIFDYTAIEIRMCRFFLSLSLVAWLPFFWLTDEIDTRVASYQAKHFNLPLIADIVPSFLFAAFDCMGIQPPIVHKRNDRSYIVFPLLIASKFLLLPGFKCRRNCYSLFWTGYSVGWGRDA